MDIGPDVTDFSDIDITFELHASTQKGCIYAQLFSEWVAALLRDVVSEDPNPVRINQGKVLLQDKLHEFRGRVPRSHRIHVSDAGHRCIWHVYEEAFWHLHWLQVKITPPLLFIPPGNPPEFPGANFNGTFIGFEE